MSKLFNFVGFQLVWFSCILGAANQKYWMAYLATAVFVSLHFLFMKKRTSDAVLLASGLGIGICIDSMLMNAGLFEFNNHSGFVVPLWLLCLWCVFPLTINYSLLWLRGKMLIAAIFGGVGGGLSYLAGQKLGAVIIHQDLITLSVVAVFWAAITPLFLLISSQYDHEEQTA